MQIPSINMNIYAPDYTNRYNREDKDRLNQGCETCDSRTYRDKSSDSVCPCKLPPS